MKKISINRIENPLRELLKKLDSLESDTEEYSLEQRDTRAVYWAFSDMLKAQFEKVDMALIEPVGTRQISMNKTWIDETQTHLMGFMTHHSKYLMKHLTQDGLDKLTSIVGFLQLASFYKRLEPNRITVFYAPSIAYKPDIES